MSGKNMIANRYEVVRHIGQGEPLLHVVADILDGLDGQGVFDDEDAPVALGELPGQQKNHLINIYFGQRFAEFFRFAVHFRTDALNTPPQTLGKGQQQIGAVLIRNVVEEFDFRCHLRLHPGEAVRLKVHLEKPGGTSGAHMKGVDHMGEDDHHLPRPHCDGLPVDHNITFPLCHHAHLHIFVTVGTK